MKRIFTAMLVAVTVLFSMAGTSAAPEPDAAGGATTEAALHDIAASLRVLVHEQRILIGMRRLELAERRLAPQRAELREARGEVRQIEEEIAHLGSVVESFRAQVETEIERGLDPAGSRAEIAQIESILETQRERLESAERRAVDAEADLDLARRDVDRVEALLEELLESFDAVDGRGR